MLVQQDRGNLQRSQAFLPPAASSVSKPLMADGLKKLGLHGLSRVLLLDGQQQPEMTGKRPWHGGVTGGGQDGHRHPDILHASVGKSIQTRHKPWRHANKRNDAPDSWTAGAGAGAASFRLQ